MAIYTALPEKDLGDKAYAAVRLLCDSGEHVMLGTVTKKALRQLVADANRGAKERRTMERIKADRKKRRQRSIFK